MGLIIGKVVTIGSGSTHKPFSGITEEDSENYLSEEDSDNILMPED